MCLHRQAACVCHPDRLGLGVASFAPILPQPAAKKTQFRMTNIARFCESHLRELLHESELQTAIARQFFTSCANQNKLVSGILGAGGQKIHQLRKAS